MAKKFATLVSAMSPSRQARVRARTDVLLRNIRLQELRQIRNLSQEALAEVLGSTQAGVSKLERRDDLYLSSLRDYIEALGGKLEIRARFPDGDFTLANLGSEQLLSGKTTRPAAGTTTSRGARTIIKSRKK